MARTTGNVTVSSARNTECNGSVLLLLKKVLEELAWGLACSAFLFLFLKTPVTDHSEGPCSKGYRSRSMLGFIHGQATEPRRGLDLLGKNSSGSQVAASPSSCQGLQKGGEKKKTCQREKRRFYFIAKLPPKFVPYATTPPNREVWIVWTPSVGVFGSVFFFLNQILHHRLWVPYRSK